MLIEVESWPYSFPASEDFPSSSQRGNISGRLLVQDRYYLLIFYYYHFFLFSFGGRWWTWKNNYSTVIGSTYIIFSSLGTSKIIRYLLLVHTLAWLHQEKPVHGKENAR